MDEAEIKKLSVEDLEAKLPDMSDDEVKLAHKIEIAKGSKARTTAIAAIAGEAEDREIDLEAEAGDDQGKAKEPETQEQKIARLQAAADEALMAEIEADPRKAFLRLFRQLEFLANHLNIRLPS